jgi:uncharacterized protein YbjT (DUF2867 family)
LEAAFAGVQGVYSVQNHHISGYEGEIREGKNVVDAVARGSVPHLVYASAGIGDVETGVGSWETKRTVTAHAHRLGVPLTVLRPMALMELMTDRKFYPAASVWHLMPKIMGATRPVGWISVDDVAVIVAKAFDDPESFIGRDLPLASDVQSIEECKGIWREVTGRAPRRFPIAGPDARALLGHRRDDDVAVAAGQPRGARHRTDARDPSRRVDRPAVARRHQEALTPTVRKVRGEEQATWLRFVHPWRFGELRQR